MISASLQLLLAILYANLGEWLMHKFILHRLGKQPGSIWAYHWYEHHAICAKHQMLDPGYRHLDFSTWNAQTKELAVLAAIVIAHLPLFWYLPAFIVGLYGSLTLYYILHRKAHLDPQWAKQHLPWHYQHHTQPGSGNWCVTWPGFDYLLGTRNK
ncbi:hypothetical protein [Methylomonas albis]|uniref:Sterol desaturase family protein n=1 Tax=Methylomonas albis TaxID=1854563 RepID=A0ABR9D7F8_9GAMM|nr:sterol desaturase family protein [Methylomonas albis]MBD9358179.1 sterol desaturase family protein [Methylomonas albis]CAD6881552.1 hypothetical protein [Methylomonas albis]